MLQLDPSRDAAWKHLGYKRMGGHWDKPERVAAAKAEAQAQHKADKHWKPILEKLSSRTGKQRQGAARSSRKEPGRRQRSPRRPHDLGRLCEWWTVQHQKFAVRLLGQIDSPGSSRALALLALMSRSAEVRSNATKILRQRDPRDFAAVLIALLRDPIKYEVRPVNGPGSQGQLVIKQTDKNVKRLYSPLSAPNVPILPGDRVSMDANGLPVVIRELGTYQTAPVPIGNASLAAVAGHVRTARREYPRSYLRPFDAGGASRGTEPRIGSDTVSKRESACRRSWAALPEADVLPRKSSTGRWRFRSAR